MKYDQFRRSDNVEDYRDPNKPVVDTVDVTWITISEQLKITNSDIAKDLGDPTEKK